MNLTAADYIPPMTHEYGRHWHQPDRASILMDETSALMSRRNFELLAEYSATIPTAVYEGKMWRRHDGAHDRAYLMSGGRPEWLLCWYGPSDNPTKCCIYKRVILLDEGALPGEGE